MGYWHRFEGPCGESQSMDFVERTKDSSAHHQISPTLFFHDCLGGNLVRNFEKSLEKEWWCNAMQKGNGMPWVGLIPARLLQAASISWISIGSMKCGFEQAANSGRGLLHANCKA